MKYASVPMIILCSSMALAADNLTDSNRLFAWAELNYPQYFSPAGAETIAIEGYLARYYSSTHNYLGTLGTAVYVYGDVFNGLINVGKISDFIPMDMNTYTIVDTGQTDCFSIEGHLQSCTDSGQDGFYSGNPPDFTKNEDGTITDHVTGLIWLSSPDTNGDNIVNTNDKLSQKLKVIVQI
jgi:hypothetical protein